MQGNYKYYIPQKTIHVQGPLLLTLLNFNPSMDT